MPDLFSPLTIKDVTLRNRIAMSPMTQHRAVDGRVGDFHVMLTGSRAAGGFGLVFPEQIAITADGRTSVHCAGIWEDGQIEGLARITRIVKEMGGATPTRRGARSTPASSGLRCTSRTATSARASCRRWPTGVPTRMEARWRTACATTSRRLTRCARSGPSDCR